jgi:hypothetical protein
MPIKKNTLVTKSGKELATWEGYHEPKELKRAIKQCLRMGGKVVVSWV